MTTIAISKMRLRAAPLLRIGTGVVMLLVWMVVTAVWWALALAPVSDPPPWLEVARSVCFGSTPTGLPDTYGWIVLICGPASMLGGILATWGSEIVAHFVALWRLPFGRAVLVATLAVSVTGIGWAAMRINNGVALASINYAALDEGPLPPAYPRIDKPVPSFTLVDQHGASFGDANLRGRVTLLTFAFAHCKTVCPVILEGLRKAATAAHDPRLQAVVITLDPWRDTPSRLTEIQDEWSLPLETHLLSGDVESVTKTLDALGVAWKRNENDGEVVHAPLVYVVGGDGRIAYGFNNPSPQWLVDATARAASAN